jgi:two-component system, OmpR family, KDP operon response regulator KdpE
MAVTLLVVGTASDLQGHTAGLPAHGFTLSLASSLGDAVRCVLSEQPDGVLVIAESSSAPETCEVLRALGDVPVMAAASRPSPDLATQCLDAGADAVVPLTAPSAELAARVRAVLRRTRLHEAAPAGRIVAAGGLVIDLDERTVRRLGTEIRLSPTEFNLLAVLAEHPGRVVSNGEILTRVWGPEYRDDIHYVRLYVGYLRGKLELDPAHPTLIINQWGVGYRLATFGHDVDPTELEASAHPAPIPIS